MTNSTFIPFIALIGYGIGFIFGVIFERMTDEPAPICESVQP